MAGSNTAPVSGSVKWAPQVVLLLDGDSRVLHVNRSLAGNSFAGLSTNSSDLLHEQLHPACNSRCRFTESWKHALLSLQSRDSVEWEIDDAEFTGMLRLHLVKTPTPLHVENERRERHMLLTITDITKHRQEHETLVANQQALMRLLMSRNSGSGEAAAQEFDETGDTGNRLMAGFSRREKSLGRQLVLAQESERKRIASELHDGIAQTIGVMKYKIETQIANLSQLHPDIDLGGFETLVDDIRGLIDEIRRISNNLAPSVLSDFGIRVALEYLCKESSDESRKVQAQCANDIDESETPDLVKIAIYRVVQEALNNAVKHSQATEIKVRLDKTDHGVRLTIADNGIGFDSSKVARGQELRSGSGLRNMRERVDATGGQIEFESRPGQGVIIRADWDDGQLDSIKE